jgi:hypothetical protein
MTMVPKRVYERLVRWADRDDETGCLVSRYSVGSHGYAQVGWSVEGKTVVITAHAALWQYLHGPLESGQTVDHTCPKGRNRKCIEITHLRELSNLDNARRTNGRDWPLGQCAQGHPDSEWHPKSATNKKGYCNVCSREATRRKRASRASHLT